MLLISAACLAQSPEKATPLRVGVAGLTHSHVHWILRRAHDGDIEIVGIAEPDKKLAERFLKQYNLSMGLVYPSLDEMLDKTKPEAVTAFNSKAVSGRSERSWCMMATADRRRSVSMTSFSTGLPIR